MNKIMEWYKNLSNCCRIAIILTLILLGVILGTVRAKAFEVGIFTTTFDQQEAPGLVRASDGTGAFFGHTWEGDSFGVGFDGYLFNNSNGQDIYIQWRLDEGLALRAGTGSLGSTAVATVDVNGVPVQVSDTDRTNTRWIQVSIGLQKSSAVFLRLTKATFDYNFTASRTVVHRYDTHTYTGGRSDSLKDTYVWLGVVTGF